MRLKTLLAALLMISLLTGCSLPATLATQITTLTAPNSPAPSSFADEELLTQEDAKQIPRVCGFPLNMTTASRSMIFPSSF